MGRLDGKVALVTGGARGQGRSHAVRMAQEGASIVVTDIATQLPSVPYEMATEADLQQTVKLVEDLDQRCVAVKADARDAGAMAGAVEQAVSEFGRVDVASVNHGIASGGDAVSPEADWDEMLDVNLKGVWISCGAIVAQMRKQGGGGAIVLTASAAGIRPFPGILPYSVAKHGVIGLMRNLAAELAPEQIRVNAVCPGVVDTPMVRNTFFQELFTGGVEGASWEDVQWPATTLHPMEFSSMEAVDISNAVLFLLSDEARYITGVELPVDGGLCIAAPGVPRPAAELLGQLTAE